MAGPPWDADPPGSDTQIAANLASILARISDEASTRPLPTLGLAAEWHQDLYAGVPVPSVSYLANPRDSDPLHPDLIDYEVRVGLKHGVPAALVPDELAAFIKGLRTAGAVEAWLKLIATNEIAPML